MVKQFIREGVTITDKYGLTDIWVEPDRENVYIQPRGGQLMVFTPEKARSFAIVLERMAGKAENNG